MKSKSKVEQLVPSVILAELEIFGDILGEGALEVSGKVHGQIRCVSLTIHEGGLVHGDIVAEKVEVFGEVVGNVTAKKIVCGAAAKVSGDILHSEIHIENGAYIDGSCRKVLIEEVAEDPAENVVELEIAEHNPEDLVYKKES